MGTGSTALFTTKDVNKFVNNFLETKKITKGASLRLKNSDATTPRPQPMDNRNYTKKTFPYDQYFFSQIHLPTG